MANRLDLQAEFEQILGSRNVYFQPPSANKMKYPCIRYKTSAPDIKRANDKMYLNVKCYEGVIIDSNPDSTIPDKLLEHFKMCSVGDSYVADNLNHYPFTIYY